MRPTLSDSVVTLRPLEMADCEAVYASVRESITELSQWLPWCHAGYAPADTAGFVGASIQWWAEGSQFTFGMFDATDGAHIGVIGVNHLNRQHRFANIGYWVRTGRTRRGYAARAVHLIARFAFDTLGMTRVEIATDPDNLASRRVAEKAGATLECVARNRIIMRGRPLPAALYSLVPGDVTIPSAPETR
jgi:ribosomal-protein-serine acetyltransferase